jgi:hypothetical protein
MKLPPFSVAAFAEGELRDVSRQPQLDLESELLKLGEVEQKDRGTGVDSRFTDAQF